MTCCESQPSLLGLPRTSPDAPLRDAAASFAAELTRAAFAPLAKALGFYGDIAVANVAQSMARQETGGLTDTLTSLLARVPR